MTIVASNIARTASAIAIATSAISLKLDVFNNTQEKSTALFPQFRSGNKDAQDESDRPK
jgi:hypothetical protein